MSAENEVQDLIVDVLSEYLSAKVASKSTKIEIAKDIVLELKALGLLKTDGEVDGDSDDDEVEELPF